MVQNGSGFCPVFVTRFYFKRFGFRFGNQGKDDRYVNCRIRRINQTWILQAGAGLIQTTATEQLRNLLSRIGCNWEGVTDKSVKMEGVTRTLDAGATMMDVANQGRWKLLEIVQTYKHNSNEYKISTARLVPYTQMIVLQLSSNYMTYFLLLNKCLNQIKSVFDPLSSLTTYKMS